MTAPEVADRTADLALAHTLADAADAVSMSRFLAADLRVDTKPDRTPVTEADQAIEEQLRARVTVERPGDAFAGEETGGFTAGAVPTGRTWIVDPIDGTANYLRGVPVWASLIALVDDGHPVVGVVSAPALGRRWWGAEGVGAFVRTEVGAVRTERRLQVSGVRDLADASFSFSDSRGWTQRCGAGRLEALSDRVWRTRAYGDFYSHLLVAEGAVDIAAEPDLNPWDVAALVPIIREAGGTMTGYDGSDVLVSGSGLTTNGLLLEPVLSILAGSG